MLMDILNSVIKAEEYEKVTYFPIPYPYSIAPLLSCVSTVIAVILCLSTKSHRQPLTKMIIAINLSDFLFVLPKVLPVFIGSDWYCKTLHVISRFGVLGSVFWSALFAHAFMTIVKHEQMEILEDRIRCYSVIGLIFPAVLVVGVLAGGMEYNPTITSCVHLTAKGFFDWINFFSFAFPVMMGCLFSCLLYIKTARKLYYFVREGQENHIFTLVVYPAILIVCWIPSLFLTFLLAIGVNVSNDMVTIFQAWDQLQGFFNGIAYTMSRQMIVAACKRCCCKREKETIIETDENFTSLNGTDGTRSILGADHSFNDSFIKLAR